ncbi:MAG TPA: prepilin-type N-terminal cleavage/methylation domain-containing protein [Burkholderiaceae bacterium]
MSRNRRANGFTLVEVMVALVIMAILAALAMRGMDALMRAKESALASTDRTLKLNTGMSQFEYDMAMVVDSHVLPKAIMFDGATLRIARRTPQGIQLVLWSLQDRRWQRWASAPVIHMSELTDAWMRSQQWAAISAGAITVLENVDDFQVYVCNPATLGTSGCSWNNVQSTQGAAQNQPVCPPGQTCPPPAAAPQPNGIKISLKVPEGEILRERELPRFGGAAP